MKYLGIDPGLEGAIAYIDGLDVHAYDMPVSNSLDGKKNVDYYKVYGLIKNINPDAIYIEKQHPQGVTGKVVSFSMGRNYQALLIACKRYSDKHKTPIFFVLPQQWKKTLGLLNSKSDTEKNKKTKTIEFVKRMFPKTDIYSKTGLILDGRTDALALAEYGRNK